MGAKSSNITLTTKDMLPLFQVVSDLEKPTASVSLRSDITTNCSKCSRADCGVSPCDSFPNQDSEFVLTDLSNRVIDCFTPSETSCRKRSKKRRRLRAKDSSSSFSFVEDIPMRSNMSNTKRRHLKSGHKFTLKPNIHLTLETGEPSPKSDGRKTGMFAEMALKGRHDKINLSRRFKSSSNENIPSKSDECPVYEDPKDLIVDEMFGAVKKKRRIKKVKKLDGSSDGNDSKFLPDIHKGKRRISKKAIIKNYEFMLEKLMKKCEEKDALLFEREESFLKMRKKLQETLFFNNQFADENEFLKSQHVDMKNCIEQYKKIVESFENQRNESGEIDRCKTVVDSNQAACPKCSIVELSALKIEKENTGLNEDIIMLKNVIFSLNVQLSQYQEKIKTSTIIQNSGRSDINTPEKTSGRIDSNNLNIENVTDQKSQLISNLNLDVLTPVFIAYQDSLSEKDNLILDYEKQFNRLTQKLKEIIFENKNLVDSSTRANNELVNLREAKGLSTKERDELRKENSTLKSKNENLEERLKNIQEMFEQKVSTMTRDYTMIHQEYFKTKTGLAMAHGRCQALEQKNSQVEMIPVKIHVTKLDECKRMLEELKIRYELDKNKYTAKITILEENNASLEKKYMDVSNEKHRLEIKLKNSEKFIRKYKNMIVSYRKEVVAVKSSRDIFKNRATRATNLCRQLSLTLDQTIESNNIQNLKAETMTVHKEALKELNELESRMKQQDVTLDMVRKENDVEIMRLEEILREKDAMIEAMRLRIQGESLPKYIQYTLPKVNQAVEANTNKNRDRVASAKM